MLGGIAGPNTIPSDYAQALAAQLLLICRQLARSDFSNANWTLLLAQALEQVANLKLNAETARSYWFRTEAAGVLKIALCNHCGDGRFAKALDAVHGDLAKTRDRLVGQNMQIPADPAAKRAGVAAGERRLLIVYNYRFIHLLGSGC